MDGVLLHSSPLHERAYREALSALPVRDFDYRQIAGMRTDEAVAFVLARNAISATPEERQAIVQNKSRRARELIAAANPVDAQAASVLDALSRYFQLALASSASPATVELFLSANNFRPFFEVVLNGGDVRHAKPAPAIYSLAAARLGLLPQACLVVEDAVSGVAAGKSAGTAVWAVPSTSAPDELTRAGADRIIPDLAALLALVRTDNATASKSQSRRRAP